MPRGPAEAPLQVRPSERVAPLHCMGSAHDGTFMHGCARDAGYPDTPVVSIPLHMSTPNLLHSTEEEQLCRQWQLSRATLLTE